MNTWQIVVGVLFLASASFAVLGYPNGYGALTPRSRLFRTLGIFLLTLLIGLAWLAPILDSLPTGVTNGIRIRALLYLASCLFLALGLLCIAFLDALETLSSFRREQRKNMEAIVREEMERANERKARRQNGSMPDGE